MFRTGSRNDKEHLVWIIENAEQLVASSKIFRETPFAFEFQFGLFQTGLVDLDWLSAHKDQPLVIRDEYGDVYPLDARARV